MTPNCQEPPDSCDRGSAHGASGSTFHILEVGPALVVVYSMLLERGLVPIFRFKEIPDLEIPGIEVRRVPGEGKVSRFGWRFPGLKISVSTAV